VETMSKPIEIHEWRFEGNAFTASPTNEVVRDLKR